ncbi:MAG: T9SS type A sorting domain-containing protein, partial [Chitinophagales bacterium]
GLGRVYIADYDNNKIRLVSYPAGVKPLTEGSAGMNVYPNPAKNGSFTVMLPEAAVNATLTVTDITGKEIVKIKDTKAREIFLNLGNLPSGSYFVKASAGDKVYKEQVILVK